jgi:3-phytase
VQRTRSVFAGHLSKAILIAAAFLAAAPFLNAADPVASARFGFDVDGACEDGRDVFASDGDNLIYHFWRTEHGLRPVRTLHVNPDVELCAVGPTQVYFLDPEFGILAFERSPEAYPLIRPVFIQPPAGRGSFVPETFELIEGESGPVLLISGEGRNMRLAAPVLDRHGEVPTVVASAETDPVQAGGDAADDAAVIAASGTGIVLGADKQAGLRVYNMEGDEQVFLASGKLNNVDALALGEGRFLAAASNRTTIAVDLFEVEVDPLKVENAGAFALDFADPYGLCMGQVEGVPHVFVGDTTGQVEAWRPGEDKAWERVLNLQFDTQTEGCVYDAVSGLLYVGEEEAGIWSVDLDNGEKTLVHAVDGEILVADVEGLDIYYGAGERYLVASSQGDDSFVVYSLPGNQRLLKFRIAADHEGGVDGASETDGLSVNPQPLPGYPAGVLVVQDGYNVAPGENQNFKIVDWRAVQALIDGS